MCTKLYTDVLVASKVADSYRRSCRFLKDNAAARDQVYISVKSCLARQKDCKSMGIENVFTGPDHSQPKEEWNEKDYELFLSRFPQYFVKEGSTFYKVNIASMLDSAVSQNPTDDQIIQALRDKLLVNGAYTDRILSALEL